MVLYVEMGCEGIKIFRNYLKFLQKLEKTIFNF